MASVTVEPAGPRDLAIHAAHYERLRAALEREGYHATIDRTERRSADALQVVGDVGIHVGEIMAADALIRLGALITRHLRGMRRGTTGEPRHAVIDGPNSEILSRVLLPDGD